MQGSLFSFLVKLGVAQMMNCEFLLMKYEFQLIYCSIIVLKKIRFVNQKLYLQTQIAQL